MRDLFIGGADHRQAPLDDAYGSSLEALSDGLNLRRRVCERESPQSAEVRRWRVEMTLLLRGNLHKVTQLSLYDKVSIKQKDGNNAAYTHFPLHILFHGGFQLP